MTDPQEIHRLEQAAAGARNLAVLVRRYYESLTEQGFEPRQALYLTSGWPRDVLEQAHRGDA